MRAEICGLAVDGSLTEEGELPDFDEELIPALRLHITEAFLRVEAVLVDDSRNHWDTSLHALLHVVGLAHDPIVIVPTGIQPALRVLVALHHLVKVLPVAGL